MQLYAPRSHGRRAVCGRTILLSVLGFLRNNILHESFLQIVVAQTVHVIFVFRPVIAWSFRKRSASFRAVHCRFFSPDLRVRLIWRVSKMFVVKRTVGPPRLQSSIVILSIEFTTSRPSTTTSDSITCRYGYEWGGCFLGFRTKTVLV